MSAAPAVAQAVRVENVSVAYGRVEALRQVSLEVRPGEMVALLGPSGCGKTTLLRTIAGFLPHTGEVYIGADRATRVPSHRRNIGMVFQDYALFPHMTIADNVGFGLRMRRLPRPESADRVAEAIALVGLGGTEARYPHQLSGGQQQRVALARALVIQPSVLLLDEPLSALDKKLREEMEVELRLLQRRVGITTIFVTHDQEEALAISDRIAVMQRGEILQLGTPEEIYDRPRHPFVSAFVGKSNRLAGIVVERLPGGLVCELPGGLRVRVAGAESAPIGSRIAFAVRPEKILLGAGEGAAENSVEAKVRNRIYFGMFTELRVELSSGEELAVVCQNSAQAGGRATPGVGDTVRLSWSAAACQVLE